MELTGDTARKLGSAARGRAFILRLDLHHNDHVIDYHRGFFERHQWLEDGLSWTVVQPLDEEIMLDDLLRRQRAAGRGGRPRRHSRQPRRLIRSPTDRLVTAPRLTRSEHIG